MPILELTSKDLVGSLSTQNHLDSHGLDLSTQKVHWCTGSDRCHVIGLEVINDLWNGVQTFLQSESVFVMHCAEEIGSFSRCEEIWGFGKTNGKGMQSWPGSQRCVGFCFKSLSHQGLVYSGRLKPTWRSSSCDSLSPLLSQPLLLLCQLVCFPGSD